MEIVSVSPSHDLGGFRLPPPHYLDNSGVGVIFVEFVNAEEEMEQIGFITKGEDLTTAKLLRDLREIVNHHLQTLFVPPLLPPTVDEPLPGYEVNAYQIVSPLGSRVLLHLDLPNWHTFVSRLNVIAVYTGR